MPSDIFRRAAFSRIYVDDHVSRPRDLSCCFITTSLEIYYRSVMEFLVDAEMFDNARQLIKLRTVNARYLLRFSTSLFECEKTDFIL